MCRCLHLARWGSPFHISFEREHGEVTVANLFESVILIHQHREQSKLSFTSRHQSKHFSVQIQGVLDNLFYQPTIRLLQAYISAASLKIYSRQDLVWNAREICCMLFNSIPGSRIAKTKDLKILKQFRNAIQWRACSIRYFPCIRKQSLRISMATI